MKISLDPQKKSPIYQQIVDQIHFAINTGNLKPGERLPSLRDIAYQNKISINTVVKAFKELERMHLINARDRRAYYVCQNPKIKLKGRYAARGVSATKSDVHAAIQQLDSGIFPNAFCKITNDYLTGDPNKCNIIHSDGSGTKSLIAYLHYKETGDASVFRGIAQDSIVMNIDDLLCVGATQNILLSSTLNRNVHNFPSTLLTEVINGTESFLQTLREYGVDIHNGGGETADVGDLTATVTVDSSAVAVMHKDRVITGNEIKPGQAIIGIASDGKANYETVENSGIGSNGLTSARHDLLSPYYKKKYPETFDSRTPNELVYCGPYKMEDPLPNSSLTVGQALLSPTRTYAPVIKALLDEHFENVKALIHCSGGGQTKCLRFGQGIHFVKNNLMPTPSIFKTIQEVSQTSWKEMYQVYNMGHRMEVYCPKAKITKLLNTIRQFGLEAEQIGHTEKSQKTGKRNHLTLRHGKRAYTYDQPN